MPGFTRKELEEGFASYCDLREQSSAKQDWSIWGGQFSEDAHYVEHAYGEFHGRAAIVDWITKVMAPFPHMTFPNDWAVMDTDQGCVVFQCQNRLAHPTDPGGEPFQFPTWSLIRYAGNGLWSYEEDMYNPKEGGEAISGWIKAGGQFQSRELVKMVKA
jgi:hypothetical protein